MKHRPIFLNLARGLSVNEEDLADALDKGIRTRGRLGCAQRRAWPDLKGHILANRENVIITPHAAFYSTQSMEAIPRISCENINTLLRVKRTRFSNL